MPGLPENMDAYRPALRGRKHMVAAGLALGVVQSDLVNVAGADPRRACYALG